MTTAERRGCYNGRVNWYLCLLLQSCKKKKCQTGMLGILLKTFYKLPEKKSGDKENYFVCLFFFNYFFLSKRKMEEERYWEREIQTEASWQLSHCKNGKNRIGLHGKILELFQLHSFLQPSSDGDLLNMTPGCSALWIWMGRQKRELIVFPAFKFNLVHF